MLLIISHWRNLISTYVRTVLYIAMVETMLLILQYIYIALDDFFHIYIALDAVHLLSKRVHQCTLYQTKIRIST